jgi:DNA-cytosine methyltransferase
MTPPRPPKLRELSLFSGIGGGLLGSMLLDWHTVAAVDFEPYCCEVLARRKQDGFFKEPFDIFCMDIGEFNRRVAPIYTGQVDIITGGFPCQPFSCAGQRKGSDDSRNGFPVLAETIRIVRPRYLLLENVPALLNFEYFGEILSTLSACGYDVRWKVISAGELGAPHRRDRLWIMAYPKGNRNMRESCDINKKKNGQGDTLSSEFVSSSSLSCTSEMAQSGSVRGTEGSEKQGELRGVMQDGQTRSESGGSSEALPHPDSLGCGRGGDMERCGFNTNDQEQHTATGESTRQGRECESGKAGDDVSNTISEGRQGHRQSGNSTGEVDFTASDTQSRKVTWWDNDPAESLYGVKPEMGKLAHEHTDILDFTGTNEFEIIPRVVTGYKGRVEELKGLGNAQVPICMATAWKFLTNMK